MTSEMLMLIAIWLFLIDICFTLKSLKRRLECMCSRAPKNEEDENENDN